MFSTQDLRTFQTHLSSLALSSTGTSRNRRMEVALRFPGSVGALSRCMASEAFAPEKWPLSRRFAALCDSQYAGGWQSYLPWRNERHPLRLCFGPQLRSCGPPPCFRNPIEGSQASSVRRKQTATGWIFKHLLGCTLQGLLRRKRWILAPRPGIQVDAQGVSL